MKIFGVTFLSIVVCVGVGLGGYTYFGPAKKINLGNQSLVTGQHETERAEVELEAQSAENKTQEEIVTSNQLASSSTSRSGSPVIEEQEQKATGNKEVVADNQKMEGASEVKVRLINWGFQAASNRKISAIILHSSYDALGAEPYDFEGLLKEYKQYGVSAHYVIDRAGQAYQLVKEKDVAYHAGVSKLPDGTTNVNAVSIGIELMNTEKDSYTSAQYAATNDLIAQIKSRYQIKHVLGHKDIAPDRKTDPWGFDFSELK